MLLMKKEGKVQYVPDAFVSAYRERGWVPADEPEHVDIPEPVAEVERVAKVEEPVQKEQKPTPSNVCPFCGKQYATEANLKKHIEAKHSSD